MPAPQQGALLSAAVLAFTVLLGGTKVMVKNYGPLPVLSDLDRATNFKDPQVAAAFAVGLVASLFVFFYFFASSESWLRTRAYAYTEALLTNSVPPLAQSQSPS